MASTAARSDGSSGSAAHATVRLTDSGFALLNSVVGMSGCWLANWMASLPMHVPGSAQNAAAALKTSLWAADAGCHAAGPRLVSRPLPYGDPLITPTPSSRAAGRSSSSRVSWSP